MSQVGINACAGIFSIMQLTRERLLRRGSANPDTPGGQADLLLGQMLEVGKDAMKDQFIKITSKPGAGG